MKELKYKSFCWVIGTTSFRTAKLNLKIEQQLRLLDKFHKSINPWEWNNSTQEKYYDFMKNKEFISGDATRKDKDAREKTSGLVDIGLITEDRLLTAVGKKLLEITSKEEISKNNIFNIEDDSFIYLKQLLKTSINIDGKFVKPYIVLVYCLEKLEYLTYDEFTYFIPLITDKESLNEIIENIKRYRKNELKKEDIICKKFISMENYQEAKKVFLDNEVTEELICSVGMNRKSKTYDKIFFQLYQLLKAIFIDKNNQDYLKAFETIDNITGKSSIYWKRLIFNSKKSIDENCPFKKSKNEDEFKKIFFKYLHTFKAMATLEDYFDLNRRYLALTETFIFEDNLIKLDIFPKYYFRETILNLIDEAFIEDKNLKDDIELSQISNSLKVNLNKIYSDLSKDFNIEITNPNEANKYIQDERYKRFNNLIENKFSDEILLKLLEYFEKREDKEIEKLVTDEATIPTIFEYILGIIWYKASEFEGNILEYMKLSLEANLLPRTHAAGGYADIIYEYNENKNYPKHSLLIEATLSDGSNQRKMKMEPVSRHLGDYRIKSKNPFDYSLFITTLLEANIITDFRFRKIMPYEKNGEVIQGMKIIPIDTNFLKEIIKNKVTYKQLYLDFEEHYQKELGDRNWYKNMVEETNKKYSQELKLPLLVEQTVDGTIKENKFKNRIEELGALLKKYSDSYYNDSESLVSDYEYDKLLKELESLEEKYPQYREISSPTTSVGASLKENKFKKVEHIRPMLSLANSYNIGEIVDFIERIKKKIPKEQELKYCLEVKLDGLSISLTYRQGKLVRAVTRGDGLIGEDVTENILEIASIVKTLPQAIDMEIRGEVVLPLASFEKLNNERLEKGEELFANPRNAASGTLRQLDSKIVKERGLDAYFYFLVEADKLGLKSHSESIKFLESMGIKTTGIFELLETSKEIEKRIDYWEKERENLPYETDGLVIKVDEINLWNEIGYTSKTPRWAIAYKFPAHQVSTILNDVTWQVGRTGKLTPVAELQEVELSGSKVKRASLHNISEIQRKDIRIGDRVFIEKAAEIIPQVVKSIKEDRTGNEKIIEEPINCPVCNHKLEREEGLVDIKCVNEECPAKVQGEIEYFVSRDALNIMGLGSKIVEKFIDLGYIKTVVDIFDLKNYREALENIDKMGKKSIENLLNSIEESKNRDYDKIIYALGIAEIGKVTSKILAKASKNIDKLMTMTFEELTSIDGIGEIAANEIISFFSKEKNQKIIQGLKEKGLKFEIKENETNVQNINPNFAGKNFLFTGTLKHFTREQIKEEIEKLGGKNLSSVSKNLDYLIVGEKAGSKLKKAQEIPTIKILTEEEFIELKDKFD